MRATHDTGLRWPARDRLAAVALAVALPALLAWLGLRQWTSGAPATASPALQVVWLERTPTLRDPDMAEARVPLAPQPAAAAARPRERASAAAPRESALQVVRIPAEAATATAEPPSGARLLQQAADIALATDPAVDFRQDVLANRSSAHDRVTDGRFAMRQSRSAADVVTGVGQLLFGGSPDPCPEIRADIARHQGVGGNHERLEEALRRDRAGRCR